MQSTPSFDAICSIQWAVQKLKRYSELGVAIFRQRTVVFGVVGVQAH